MPSTVDITVATRLAAWVSGLVHTQLSWTAGSSLPCPSALRSASPVTDSTQLPCSKAHSCAVRSSSSPSEISHTAGISALCPEFRCSYLKASTCSYGSSFLALIASFGTLLSFLWFIDRSLTCVGITSGFSSLRVILLLIFMMLGSAFSTFILIAAVIGFCAFRFSIFVLDWCPFRWVCSSGFSFRGTESHRFCWVFTLLTCTKWARFHSWNTSQSVPWSGPNNSEHWTIGVMLIWALLWAPRSHSTSVISQWFETRLQTEEFILGWFCDNWEGSGCGIWIDGYILSEVVSVD